MKNLKYSLRILIVFFTFALPWTASEALENFEINGVITSIGFDQFTVNGQSYRFAPGAKIESRDPKRRKFSDFKFGDEIWFKGVVLNGVYYVDIIVYKTPVPS